MKMLIGIPAYNESLMIGKVLKSIPKKISGVGKIDVLVVDDGSSDGTGDIAESLGAKVATHLLNRGLGGALKTILTYAKIKRYDILVTLDADGQHEANMLPKLVLPILKNGKNVVIGTRWKKGKDMPFVRMIANKIANIITLLLFGIYATDTQSGFRAFDRHALEKISLVTDGMEVSSEFFREIYIHRLKLAEVPIKAIYTDYSKRKGQRLFDSPAVFLRLLVRFFQ